MLDESEGLDSLTEAHFVSKDTAEAILIEEVEVGNTLHLIGTQRSLETARRRYLFDFVEIADVITQLAPEGVLKSIGQIFEQIIEYRGLILLELLLGRLDRIKAKHLELVSKFFQPGFGQAGIRTVFELYVALAFEPCFPDTVERQGLTIVVHGDVQREPLFLLVAFHTGIDDRRGSANLVAGKRGFAIDAPVFQKGRIGIQQEGDSFFRLHEPQLVATGLETHFRELGDERILFDLIAAYKVGLTFVHIAACLEIRVRAGKRELTMQSLIDILHFKREEAAFFIEEEFGIIGSRLEHRLHYLKELILLIKFGRGQTSPHAIEEFRDIFLRNDGAPMHKRLDDAMAQAGLHRIEALIPAYPQRHLTMERSAFADRCRDITAFIGLFVHDGKRLLAFALEKHVKTQAILIKRRTELECHGRAFDTAGDLGILPVKIVLFADGPEEPREQSIGNFHTMAVIVEILSDLMADNRKFGREFAPFGVAKDLLQRNFLSDGGKTGLILAGTEKFYRESARFREKAEKEIVSTDLGLEGPTEEVAEAVMPVFTLHRGRGHLTLRDIKRVDETEHRCGSMPTGAVECFHAVAQSIHTLFLKVDRNDRLVRVEIVTLHSAFNSPDFIFEAQREFAEIAFSFDATPIIRDILWDRVLDKSFRQLTGGHFFSSVHRNTLKLKTENTYPTSTEKTWPALHFFIIEKMKK